MTILIIVKHINKKYFFELIWRYIYICFKINKLRCLLKNLKLLKQKTILPLSLNLFMCESLLYKCDLLIKHYSGIVKE